MARKSPLTYETFVRDLPFSLRIWLSQRLDVQDTWESLAGSIPLNHHDLLSHHPVPFQARYETHNIFVFRNQRSPTQSLLEDWEIDNCQIKHLIQALLNASLVDAANHISRECTQQLPLAQPSPQQPLHRRPEDSDLKEDVVVVNGGRVPEPSLKAEPPHTHVEVNGLKENKDVANGSLKPTKSDQNDDDDQVHTFDYELLRRITGNFNMQDKVQGGNLIGTGGFGDVFYAEFFVNKFAVKRLKEKDEQSMKQFETELKTLCAYKHENLVRLLGYCSDGIAPCLVYEYVVNGSLEDRLACLNGSIPLSVPLRLEITRGTARGIGYLHGMNVTHRDIKTANILLSEDYIPKVGDFATARTLRKATDTGNPAVNKTQVIIGTTAYLDPEAHDGVVHPGLDIYSFGVVLLEIITGLPVRSDNRDNEDLKVHVREHCTPCVHQDDDDDEDDDDEVDGTIHDLVDAKPGLVWNPDLVEELYSLSKQCLERREDRKNIRYILKKLNDLAELYSEGKKQPEEWV